MFKMMYVRKKKSLNCQVSSSVIITNHCTTYLGFQTSSIFILGFNRVCCSRTVYLVVETTSTLLFHIFKITSLISVTRVPVGGEGSSAAGPGDEEAGKKGEGAQTSHPCAQY